MQDTFYNFATRLTSPLSQIIIPNNAKIEKLKRIKIKMVSYTTYDIDQESIIISINSFTKNSVYLGDGEINKGYTLLLPLNRQALSQNTYLNKTSQSNQDFDVILTQPLDYAPSSLTIEILFGSVSSGTIAYHPEWININSPVVIEILLSQ